MQLIQRIGEDLKADAAASAGQSEDTVAGKIFHAEILNKGGLIGEDAGALFLRRRTETGFQVDQHGAVFGCGLIGGVAIRVANDVAKGDLDEGSPGVSRRRTENRWRWPHNTMTW